MTKVRLKNKVGLIVGAIRAVIKRSSVACLKLIRKYSLFRASPAPNAGFIPNPENLGPHPERAPFNRSWYADKDAFRKQKQEFRKIFIKPVDVSHVLKANCWRKLSSLGTVNDPKHLHAIAEYMRQSFINAVRNHRLHAIEIVDGPGTKTFVLELSLVELNPTKVAINAAGIVAGMFIPASGLIATTATGSVAFESILRNGENNDILVTFADRQQDKLTLVNYRSFFPYGFTRLIVDEWACEFAELAMTDLEHTVRRGSLFRFLPW